MRLAARSMLVSVLIVVFARPLSAARPVALADRPPPARPQSPLAGGIAPMEAYFGESQITLTAGLTVYVDHLIPLSTSPLACYRPPLCCASAASRCSAPLRTSLTPLSRAARSYVVGFALGPLLWAPLSEMYGRRTIFIYSYAPFCAFHIGCALAQNIETLLVCRWWAGFFGSSVLTNSGGLIGDTFPARDRALALCMFAMAPFMGPVLGPIVGGFVGESVSWRWL